MRLNGRVSAAVALAVSMSCGGSLPPPATQPAVAGRPSAPPAAPSAVDALQPSAPPAGAIRGRVVHADDRRPIGRARVALTSAALGEPRVAITGTDGAYEFRSLPAGAYSIAVTRTGFAPRRFGEGRSASPSVIPLVRDQHVEGIEIAIAPAGVIVGQILDEDGQALAGALIDALVSRYENGQPTLVSAAGARSDDKGAFRLTGLPAGQYIVAAFDPAFSRVGDETGPLTYTPTYYPGTMHPDQAGRVVVVPGVEPTLKVVFNLKIVRPARVSGRLVTSDVGPLISGAVIMSPIRTEGLAAVPTRDAFILPDGTFSFRNVPPGRYQIQARGEADTQGPALFSMYAITVDGRDLSDLEMTLSPGANVEGSIVVEAVSAPRPASFAGIRVRAPLVDGGSFGDAISGDVRADGSFRIRGLVAGRHSVTVEGLEYPWVLKSVTYRGQDISDSALDAESGQEFTDVRVTITDATSEVSGAVKDDSGRVASDALVLIIPSSEQAWTRGSRRLRLVRTDANGRFRVRGLPAGEYRAVATRDLDEGDAYRRDLLRKLVLQGVPLAIADRERREIDLPLVSLAAARRTVSR